MEENDRHWRGSPLDMAGSTMDAYGIKEVVIEFDNGDEDILVPSMREEFGAYELHMWRHIWTRWPQHPQRQEELTRNGGSVQGIERTRKAHGPWSRASG